MKIRQVYFHQAITVPGGSKLSSQVMVDTNFPEKYGDVEISEGDQTQPGLFIIDLKKKVSVFVPYTNIISIIYALEN